jgi:hypothetical protein
MVRRDIQPYATATHKLDNGIAWDFAATPQMRERLENLARLERECCASLEFEVWENPGATRLRFEISGVDPNSGFFDGLDLSDPRGEQRRSSRWGKILKRGGLGAVASVFVCCVLPLALVSVAGFGFAAPLMKLDNPVSIGAGAILFATLFWLYERRRTKSTPRAPDATNGGCDC